MSQMVGNLQQAFKNVVDEADWFSDPRTKMKAKEKVEKLKTFIGYPEWLLEGSNNHSTLRKFYEGYPERMVEDHLTNVVELKKRLSLFSLSRITGKRKDMPV